MKVSINPISYYNFGRKSKDSDYVPVITKPTSDEAILQRTNQSISKAKLVIIGTCILYFLIKRHNKMRAVISDKVRETDLIKVAAPKACLPD